MHETDRAFVEAVSRLIVEHLEDERRRPALPRFEPDELRERLEISLDGRGEPLERVVQRLRDVLAFTPRTTTPRFFNQLFAGRDEAATLAEILTTLTNNSMYTYKAAGPHVLIEGELLRHMASKIGWPTTSDGMFTPGGSLSNMAGMMLARDRATRAQHDGHPGGELTVYTSTESHYSVPKAAAMLGIGRRNVRRVGVDDELRMRPELLRAAIEEDLAAGRAPIMINATSGTTVYGAFDPIGPLADIASEFDIWLHVDGAFGGSMLLHDRGGEVLDGVERADSVAWDAHKVLGAPLTCSALLVREPGLLAESLAEPADYLFQDDDDDLNPGMRSLQCGRRNDALKLWALWKRYGDRGLGERIDRLLALAARCARLVEADDRMVLCGSPPFVNVCFEVLGKPSDRICEALHRQGRLEVGYGVVRGRRVIRMVFANPDIAEEAVDEALGAILDAAAPLPEADNAAVDAPTAA